MQNLKTYCYLLRNFNMLTEWRHDLQTAMSFSFFDKDVAVL